MKRKFGDSETQEINDSSSEHSRSSLADSTRPPSISPPTIPTPAALISIPPRPPSSANPNQISHNLPPYPIIPPLFNPGPYSSVPVASMSGPPTPTSSTAAPRPPNQ